MWKAFTFQNRSIKYLTVSNVEEIAKTQTFGCVLHLIVLKLWGPDCHPGGIPNRVMRVCSDALKRRLSSGITGSQQRWFRCWQIWYLLEGLYNLSGLGITWDPPGGYEECWWGERCLGLQQKMARWMTLCESNHVFVVIWWTSWRCQVEIQVVKQKKVNK